MRRELRWWIAEGAMYAAVAALGAVLGATSGLSALPLSVTVGIGYVVGRALFYRIDPY